MKSDVETQPDWTYRLATGLYDHRTAALATCLVLAAWVAWPATGVRVDNAVQRWFAEGDSTLAAYRTFQRAFGNDEMVVVVLTPDDGVFTHAGLRTLRRATKAARRVEGVAGVTSLASLPLLEDSLADPLTEQRIARMRRKVRADSTLPPLLLGKGNRPDGAVYSAGLLVQMAPHQQIDGERRRILNALDRALRQAGDAERATAGTGVILDALNRAAMDGSARLILAANALIFLLLWLVFGRVGPVLVTMGAVGGATVWLLGLYGLLGGAFNTVTMMLPTLVLVITTADCVHLLLHAAHVDASTPRERAVRTVGFLLRPCAFTTLTTAAGFLALTTSSMPVVRELGAFAAAGLAGGLVASVVACTAALSGEWAVPKRRDGLRRMAERLAATGVRRRKAVLIGASLLVGGASLGIAQLQADTRSLGYLFEDHPARQDSRLVEERLGPYLPLEFVVHAAAGHALQPALLRAVERWERAAKRAGHAGWAWSAADVLRRLHAHLPNGRAALPQKERRMCALLEGAQTEADSALRRVVVDENNSPRSSEAGKLRVTFGVPVQSARGLQQTLQRLAAMADLPAGVTAQPSGYLPLYVHMMQQITRSQIASLAAALVVITAMIGLLFRSARAALLSLVPNLLPLALTLGAMGALGLPLDAATATIGAVALGLIVDDTVHLLHRRFYRENARHAPLPRLVADAGAPLMATTFVLAGGFAVLLLAPIRSVVWFGLLIGVATLLALAADLLVTPALLSALSASPPAQGPEAP